MDGWWEGGRDGAQRGKGHVAARPALPRTEVQLLRRRQQGDAPVQGERGAPSAGTRASPPSPGAASASPAWCHVYLLRCGVLVISGRDQAGTANLLRPTAERKATISVTASALYASRMRPVPFAQTTSSVHIRFIKQNTTFSRLAKTQEEGPCLGCRLPLGMNLP